MLLTALKRESEHVVTDLLTYRDLDMLQQRQAGPDHLACPASGCSAADHNKRYLIMTYMSEFDRIHYPLPLQYVAAPDPEYLKSIISRLRSEAKGLFQVCSVLCVPAKLNVCQLASSVISNSTKTGLGLLQAGELGEGKARGAIRAIADARQLRDENSALQQRLQGQHTLKAELAGATARLQECQQQCQVVLAPLPDSLFLLATKECNWGCWKFACGAAEQWCSTAHLVAAKGWSGWWLTMQFGAQRLEERDAALAEMHFVKAELERQQTLAQTAAQAHLAEMDATRQQVWQGHEYHASACLCVATCIANARCCAAAQAHCSTQKTSRVRWCSQLQCGSFADSAVGAAAAPASCILEVSQLAQVADAASCLGHCPPPASQKIPEITFDDVCWTLHFLGRYNCVPHTVLGAS